MCGILSDDPAAVGYMKKITFGQSVLKDWIELTEDSLYENASLMESFDLIVVSDFDPGQAD